MNIILSHYFFALAIMLTAPFANSQTITEGPRVVLEHNKVKISVKTTDENIEGYSIDGLPMQKFSKKKQQKGILVLETQEILANLIKDDTVSLTFPNRLCCRL